MREIKLTQGQVALVDDEDFEKVNQFRWFAHKRANTFYAMTHVTINGKYTTQYMHRFILGDTVGKSNIDHIDGSGLHNWRLNMRPCTPSENAMNVRKRGNYSSKYKGVCWNRGKGKWMAQIMINRKQNYLGYFVIEEDAARAYDAAAKRHDPVHCRLNFP